MQIEKGQWSLIQLNNLVDVRGIIEEPPKDRGKFGYDKKGRLNSWIEEGQVAGSLARYNHPKFKDLMEYVRMCNSHTFVLPDEPQFRSAVKTWESSYAAGIDKSLFLTDEVLPKEFTYTRIDEDGEQCPTCGKFGYLGDPSEMDLDFNDIANSTTLN